MVVDVVLEVSLGLGNEQPVVACRLHDDAGHEEGDVQRAGVSISAGLRKRSRESLCIFRSGTHPCRRPRYLDMGGASGALWQAAQRHGAQNCAECGHSRPAGHSEHRSP